MLIRRVTEHVKEQNWTAIYIDFFIVVIGVFLGIQAANWNDYRGERVQERLILKRLSSDFLLIKNDVDFSIEYHEETAEALRVLLVSLNKKELSEPDRAEFEKALRYATAFQTSADRSGAYSELLLSGQLNLIRDKDLLDELVAYHNFLDRFETATLLMVDTVSYIREPFNAAFRYDLNRTFGTKGFDAQIRGIGEYNFENLTSNDQFFEVSEELLSTHEYMLVWRRRIQDRADKISNHLSNKQ